MTQGCVGKATNIWKVGEFQMQSIYIYFDKKLLQNSCQFQLLLGTKCK